MAFGFLSFSDITILFLISVTSIYLYFNYIFKHWKRKGVPYLEPTFPFGNVKEVIFGRECVGKNIARNYKELKAKGVKYGGYYAVIEPVFIPIDPELNKIIFVKEFNSFNERGMHYNEEKDPLSAHLAAIRNPKWFFLRKKFSPTFTPAKMKMMFPLMLECGKELASVVENSIQNEEAIDINEVLARFTTDIIGSCAFGIECNSLKEPDAEFRKYGKKFFEGSLRNAIVMALVLTAPKIVKLLNITITDPSITNFFLNVIKENVDFREKNNVQRNDMMSLLIKLKNNEAIDDNKDSGPAISFNEMAAQAFIFFLGGFETSSSAMTFALYELVKNEEIQEKLRKEILEIVKKYNGELTYEAITEMIYMDNVIHETLRKYPTVPMMNRECTQNYTLPGTNIVIEKGTRVVGSPLAMHWDPEYFPDPDKFDPDRFSEERKSEIKPNTYFPWGLGPRNCIGGRFGTMQTKIGLSTLFMKYKLTLDFKTKMPLEISPTNFILAIKDPLWIKATKL